MLDGQELAYVNSFKYLGHIIDKSMSDDADISRNKMLVYQDEYFD